MDIVLVVGATFLLCWLADKGFTKLFRGKTQHLSGKAVRLNKYYGIGGLLLCVLGISAVVTGLDGYKLLLVGGGLILVVGIGLAVYYLTFGLFYDSESFLVSSFGKKSKAYRYEDIQGQLLYNNAGHILVELHMNDGRTVQLQDAMTDIYGFLDTAFAGWCAQRGVNKEDCDFHDPDNSLWFPTMEG